MSSGRGNKMSEFTKTYKEEMCENMIESLRASSFLESGDQYTKDIDAIASKLNDGDTSFYNDHGAETGGTSLIDYVMNDEERSKLEAIESRGADI